MSSTTEGSDAGASAAQVPRSVALEGGCFCGSIRYSVPRSDYPAGNCHCTMCRRTSAAAFVSWFVAPKEEFTITAGQCTTLDSSAHGKRYFCGSCGTPIACELAEHPDVIDVTICSLDDPEAIEPRRGFFVDTRLSWATTPA